VDAVRQTLSRVHASAVRAMASVTPGAAACTADGLTPREREQLAGLPPALVAAIARALRHLPIGGASLPIGIGLAVQAAARRLRVDAVGRPLIVEERKWR